MHILRDAIALLVILLIIATVRVSPLPTIEISPAHASGASGVKQPAIAMPAELEIAIPDPTADAMGAVDVDVERKLDLEDSCGHKSLQLTSRPVAPRKPIEPPCQA